MEPRFHHLARAIIIQDNHVLLAHALGHKNTFLPGGHVDFGESAQDTIIRELKEELGISCRIVRFLGIIEHKWELNGNAHFEVNQVFEVVSDELKVGVAPTSNESHLEFYWTSITEENLEKQSVQPYPFRKLIPQLLNGNNSVWWVSTLKDKML